MSSKNQFMEGKIYKTKKQLKTLFYLFTNGFIGSNYPYGKFNPPKEIEWRLINNIDDVKIHKNTVFYRNLKYIADLFNSKTFEYAGDYQIYSNEMGYKPSFILARVKRNGKYEYTLRFANIRLPTNNYYVKKKDRKSIILKEQKLSDLITVKLIKHFNDTKTEIYINNKFFSICKHLLFTIEIKNIKNYDNINSIDDIEELKYPRLTIDPETEFWGHCSNLQVWIENDYDSRLLHSNLAFPLLEKLSKLEDKIAKKKFKEEIAIRFVEGSNNTREYIYQRGYLKYFDEEELNILLDNIPNPLDIKRLDLIGYELTKIPEAIKKFKNLESLCLNNNYINIIDGLSILKYLSILKSIKISAKNFNYKTLTSLYKI